MTTDATAPSAPPAPTAATAASPSPLLSRPGAVAAEGPDAGVAWHYGDPMHEQRRLVEGIAAVDLSHRGVVTVTGPDRLSWLHSLTSQALTGLPPYTSTESLVLSPHGHVEHDLHIVDDGATTWITVEPGTAGALVAWLDSMRFMLRVEVADVSAAVAVVGEPGRAEATPGEPVAWADPWPLLAQGGVAYSAVSDLDHPGWSLREVLVPRAELAAYVEGRDLAGTWALEALRVAAWRRCPRLRTSCRSPVSASTRYAAKAPASRRNNVLDSDTSPQKKPVRCSRTSRAASASIAAGRCPVAGSG